MPHVAPAFRFVSRTVLYEYRTKSVHSWILFAVCSIKDLAYADDSAVFCTDLKSASAVAQSTKAFCEALGAAVNWENTCGFLYGGWDATPHAFEGIRWNREPCDYLGVPLKCLRNSNTRWADVAADVQENTRKWKQRNLAIFAKATLCNIFFAAKILYSIFFFFLNG